MSFLPVFFFFPGTGVAVTFSGWVWWPGSQPAQPRGSRANLTSPRFSASEAPEGEEAQQPERHRQGTVPPGAGERGPHVEQEVGGLPTLCGCGKLW